MNVLRGEEAILDAGGKWILRREPVVNREHRATRPKGKLPADHVVRIEVADHPAAAMEEDERGQRFAQDRPVSAYGDLLAEHHEPRFGDFRGLGGERGARVAVDAACDEGGDLMVRR